MRTNDLRENGAIVAVGPESAGPQTTGLAAVLHAASALGARDMARAASEAPPRSKRSEFALRIDCTPGAQPTVGRSCIPLPPAIPKAPVDYNVRRRRKREKIRAPGDAHRHTRARRREPPRARPGAAKTAHATIKKRRRWSWRGGRTNRRFQRRV